MPPTTASGKLRILLTVATLPLFSLTLQSKEVQIDDAGGNGPGDNNIAVATTLIQTVKTLKIYELDFYYGD